MRTIVTVWLAGLLLLASSTVARAQDTLSAPRAFGYVQVRETWRESDAPSASINRARIGLQGRLPHRLSYRFAAEYASAPVPRLPATVALRDAYVRWQSAPWAITAGQFKTPFSREYLMSLTVVETLDRGPVVDTLATKRDVGVQVGYLPSPWLDLSAGVFNGEGQNLFVNRDGKSMLVGRAVVRPVAEVLLGTSAATYAGDSVRWGADASIEARGALVRGEYIAQHVRGRDRDESGWYVLGAYRVMPWLQFVARHEDLLRPSLGEARRTTMTVAGVNADLPGGRTRLVLEGDARRTGSPRQTRGALLGQLQVVF